MRSLLIVLSDPSRDAWSQELLSLLPNATPLVLTGTVLEAAQYIAANSIVPSHMLIDIGNRGQDILGEIDQLAQQCTAGTRVLIVGDTNDIVLYRGLISRGVIDYLSMPAPAADVIRLLTAPVAAPAHTPAPASTVAKPPAASTNEKRVITFVSAASGDGASTAALNTAYALSQSFKGSTILVDMDYQFGMVAKNINLQNQYGIGDLFDHPDRGVDAMLIKRMVASYQDLDVITAPAELRFLPNVSAEVISNLVSTLHQTYDNVVIDLPHVWLPWVSTVIQQSTHVVLVAQLWLKSVSHAARLMRVFRSLHIPADRIIPVINRSGAKFKEAIDPKDFEHVCNNKIRYTLSNDIKTIVNAEAAGRTILEIERSDLATDIETLAAGLSGQDAPRNTASSAKTGGLFSRLKG